VRPGDWITLPSGAANGTVQEITLNTVKIQNFDNTISTVPPYTLVSSPFQNWRGMKDSGGRRVMKNITLDLTTLQFCTPEMLDRYRKEIPLIADYQPEEGVVPTNSQVYRVYIERYLCSLPVVNQDLDLIISQKEGYHVRSSYSGLFLFPAIRCGKSTSGFSRISSTICWRWCRSST